MGCEQSNTHNNNTQGQHSAVHVAPQTNSSNAPVIVNAWYGTNEIYTDMGAGGVSIADYIRRAIQHDTFTVPGDMNTFFGVDPIFGQVKKVMVSVSYFGHEYYVEGPENHDFHFPPTVDVVDAWYGTDETNTHAGSNGQSIASIINQAKHGIEIHIPGDMNTFFGVDPIFGQVKSCMFVVCVNGVQQEPVRCAENQGITWYMPDIYVQ